MMPNDELKEQEIEKGATDDLYTKSAPDSKKAEGDPTNAIEKLADGSEAPAPVAEEKKADPPLQRTYRTGTKIAAFFFFLVTAGIFAVYEYLSFTFLYLPLVNSLESFAEAIGAIFGYIFGLIYTLIFAGAQLPANIVAIILFKRLRGRSDKKWENTLFTVFFALSIVLLLITILSTVLFFAMSALS